MNSAHTTLTKIAEEKEWNTYTQLKLVLEFIESVDKVEDLEKFLKTVD